MDAHSRRAQLRGLMEEFHDAKEDFGPIRNDCADGGYTHLRAVGPRHYRRHG